MEYDDVKDNVVMIVLIVGVFRKGKLFFFGFFLKFLKVEVIIYMICKKFVNVNIV